MESALYVSLSSQIALDKRLTTIADNIANSDTVGFRATEVKFDQLISRSSNADVAYVSPGEDFLSNASGGLKKTGDDLDFAIKGKGWFALNTPAGQVLTRDGRFSMTANGDLVSVEGYPVLDAGGAPIQLDPTAAPPEAGQDGSLTQDGKLVGVIGLYDADLARGYSRYANSGVIPVGGSQPMVDRVDQGIEQGYVEESNVDPIAEMTRLIMVQRTFDDSATATNTTNGSLDQAVKVLGGAS